MSALLAKQLSPVGRVPVKSSDRAAGFDIYTNENATIRAGSSRVFSTGVALAIPREYYGKISSRSGLAFVHNIHAFEGTIDSDYRGELLVLLRNQGNFDVNILSGSRIAQIVVIPIHPDNRIELVKELPASEVNHKGFGSSGMN